MPLRSFRCQSVFWEQVEEGENETYPGMKENLQEHKLDVSDKLIL